MARLKDTKSQPSPGLNIATTAEAAAMTRLSKVTLWRMRAERRPYSPPYFRVGGRILYPVDGLQKWVTARTFATMGDAK
jgi:hypothetical protein